MARPYPDDDFLIYLQRRSAKVSESPRLVGVYPKGFHQPMVESKKEINLYWTVLREFFEEVCDGEESERNVRRLCHDWFLKESPAVNWLHGNPKSSHLECMNLGRVAPSGGGYSFGILWAINDEHFRETYSHELKRNWEVGDIIRVSSKDTDELTRLLTSKDWCAESLMVFAEALPRLAELYPDRCRVPSIKRITP